MFKALHPNRDVPISIEDYIHLLRSEPSTPPARCPSCEQPLSVRGHLEPKAAVKAHFAHERSPAAPMCPIKSEGAIRYEVLTDGFVDTEAAAELRKNFFMNWVCHWNQFRAYVRNADIKDFAAALKAVDDKRVWKYQGIQEHEVVVAMLATMDFKPVRKKDKTVLRARWVRFWFRSEVQDLQGFWNLGYAQKCLIRAEYELSERATKIREDSFRDFDVVQVESGYLTTGDCPVAHSYLQLLMSERFPSMIKAPGAV